MSSQPLIPEPRVIYFISLLSVNVSFALTVACFREPHTFSLYQYGGYVDVTYDLFDEKIII